MKNLAAALIQEKNKTATTSAWMLLVEMTLVDPAGVESDVTVRFARNDENVTFESNTYTAFPIQFDPPVIGSKGEIPTMTLRVSNIGRTLQPYMESYDGLAGSSVRIIVVNSANLSEDYSELSQTFDILSSSADAHWASFVLGAPNPLKQTYPLYRYMSQYCNWKFKGVECAYTGGDTTCDRSLGDCTAKENNERFGGYPGLGIGNIRLVR